MSCLLSAGGQWVFDESATASVLKRDIFLRCLFSLNESQDGAHACHIHVKAPKSTAAVAAAEHFGGRTECVRHFASLFKRAVFHRTAVHRFRLRRVRYGIFRPTKNDRRGARRGPFNANIMRPRTTDGFRDGPRNVHG